MASGSPAERLNPSSYLVLLERLLGKKLLIRYSANKAQDSQRLSRRLTYFGWCLMNKAVFTDARANSLRHGTTVE